ncbi:MAG: phosphatase PAP2 family protein [Proteobacteria bacterium]|nr:phosphatase PAP2 family protein [Pseudomonadota bacterium]
MYKVCQQFPLSCNSPLIIQPVFWIPWLGFIVISYFFIDQPLAHYLKEVQIAHPLLVIAFSKINSLGVSRNYLLILAAIFLWLFFISKNKIMSLWILYIMLSLIVSGLFCMLFKVLCGKARPNEWLHYHIYGFYFWRFENEFWSFPSGHVTTVSAVAAASYRVFRRFLGLWILIVSAVMFGRMICLDHYLGDVMAGAYLGFITSYLVYRVFTKALFSNHLS